MLILDRNKALSIAPLWRLAFRPFFLAGAFYALCAVPLWALAWSGRLGAWQPTGGWLAWHRHEMLFGFVLAIVAGFLLTAAQTWTGQPAPSGRRLAGLALFWLAARLAWLGGAPAVLLMALDMLFMLTFIGLLGGMLWRARQARNYPILGVLVLLGAANALSLAGLLRGEDAWQRQGALAGLWLVAALMGVIGGRVIPFFTQRGLGRTEQVNAWPWLDTALLLGTALLAILHAAGPALRPEPLLGALFLILGTGHAVRLWRWHDTGIWRVPLLWSLHLAMAWLLVATLGMALWHFAVLANPGPALHALTVGAMGGLILAMMARVSLGHTGRPLSLPGGMVAALVLFNLGAVARTALFVLWPLQGLWLAALCWSLALALFVWRYGPMLLAPRVDGHPG